MKSTPDRVFVCIRPKSFVTGSKLPGPGERRFDLVFTIGFGSRVTVVTITSYLADLSGLTSDGSPLFILLSSIAGRAFQRRRGPGTSGRDGRGAEHRMAFLVVVNAGQAWFIHEHFRDHRRCELWGAPVFDVRSKQREDVFTQEAQEGVSIAPEACFRTESRFDRVEA